MINETILLLALGILAYMDSRDREIDIRIVILAGICGIAGRILAGGINVVDMVGGVSTGLVLAAVSGITGGRIGPGDAVIFIMTGIYLGFWGNIELLMISLYMAAAVAIVMLLIMKREWDFKIPFAPFVLAAYIVILA